MEQIKNFTEYLKESSELRETAGLSIIFEDKILLVHATNSSWNKALMSIPKGGIEINENPREAAIREVKEEIGIEVPLELIGRSPQSLTIYSGVKPVKNLTYYEVRIPNLSSIGLESYSVPKSQLQISEVDWAGFVDFDKAYSKIHPSQRIILDRSKP